MVNHNQTQIFDFNNSESDEWVNDTDYQFVVNCHMRHGEGSDQFKSPPTAARFVFPPHSTTSVPRFYRGAIHQYSCGEQECRSAPGSKMCTKDHESAVVVGGQCPLLKRKDRPHIPVSDAFRMDMVEVKEMDMSGRPSFRLIKNEPEAAPKKRRGARA
jgi:hypothetical protein